MQTLPTLNSFCLYCAIGIFGVYWLQATLFVAALTLDQRKVRAKRIFLFPCCKVEEWKGPDSSISSTQLGFLSGVFDKLGQLLTNNSAKCVLLAVTMAAGGVGLWGLSGLQSKFKSTWFLPKDSDVLQWFNVRETYFQSGGEKCTVYMADLDYPNEMHKIKNLIGNLSGATDIIGNVETWYPHYENYVNYHVGLTKRGRPFPEHGLSPDEFKFFTSKFLFSPMGTAFQPNFITKPEIKCGLKKYDVDLMTFSFQHTFFTLENQDNIKAMNRVKEMIKEQNFSSRVFASTFEYAHWETIQIIDYELYRNLALSVTSVLLVTLILLADLRGSLIVMTSVLLTLVNVMGYMHFWGLTIDVVSSIFIIISIGLCIDFSAHIAHAFMANDGDKNERMRLALQQIGPAVFNGGLSTFICICLLGLSDTYIFISFFKVFTLVIIFGLFHGLIMLPILLSLIGPQSHMSAPTENLELSPRGIGEQGRCKGV